MRWLDLREEEFKEAVKHTDGVCILPVGCVEKHGQHLPMGTDVFLAEEYSYLAAEIEPAIVFPTLQCGKLFGCENQAGSVILSPELLLKMLEEYCDEIGRNGFNKIILFSGHGGNMDLLSFFAGSTLYKKKSYVVYKYCVELGPPSELVEGVKNNEYKTTLSKEDFAVLEEYAQPFEETWGHACPFETAAIMAIYPHLVRLDKGADNGFSTHRMDRRYPGSVLSWGANFPNSFSGENPNKITPSIAELEKEHIIKKAVNAIKVVKDDAEALIVNEESNTWRRK